MPQLTNTVAAANSKRSRSITRESRIANVRYLSTENELAYDDRLLRETSSNFIFKTSRYQNRLC